MAKTQKVLPYPSTDARSLVIRLDGPTWERVSKLKDKYGFFTHAHTARVLIALALNMIDKGSITNKAIVNCDTGVRQTVTPYQKSRNPYGPLGKKGKKGAKSKSCKTSTVVKDVCNNTRKGRRTLQMNFAFED